MAVADELCGRHAPVGAVAVEEEVCAEAAGVFVEVKAGALRGDLVENFAEALEAVVVSEDVVDLEVGKGGDEFFEPVVGGGERSVLVTEGAPAEVEGVAVEDEDVGLAELIVQAGCELLTD